MGKGDKKSKKGKRFRHSHGKTRPRKHSTIILAPKKTEDKPKSVEQKKISKPEPQPVTPIAIVQPAVQEIAIEEPEIKEIKQEVQLPEIKEEPITEVPAASPSPVVEEKKVEAVKKDEITEEKPIPEAPKKRGRPKKKKDE